MTAAKTEAACEADCHLAEGATHSHYSTSGGHPQPGNLNCLLCHGTTAVPVLHHYRDGAPPVTTLSRLQEGRWYKWPECRFTVSDGYGAGLQELEIGLQAAGREDVEWTFVILDGGFSCDGVWRFVGNQPPSGLATLYYCATDGAGNREDRRSVQFGIDTGHPAPVALNAIKTRRGQTATIRYRVNDPSPSCGRATVKIEIKRPDHSVAYRTTLRNVQTNKTLAYRFRNPLPSGHYRYFLSCVDGAGNKGTGTSTSYRGFRVY